MSPKRILNFRIFKYLRTFIVLVLSIIIFLLLGKYINESLYKICFIFYLLTGCYIIIFIFNLIKYFLTFVKYDKKHLEMEMLNPLTKRFEKIHCYLGGEYIVSNHINLYVNKYKDIAWAYIYNDKIVGYNIHKHFITIAYVKNKKTGEEILNKMWNYNPDILLGMDKENIEKYRRIRKGLH